MLQYPLLLTTQKRKILSLDFKCCVAVKKAENSHIELTTGKNTQKLGIKKL